MFCNCPFSVHAISVSTSASSILLLGLFLTGVVEIPGTNYQIKSTECDQWPTHCTIVSIPPRVHGYVLLIPLSSLYDLRRPALTTQALIMTRSSWKVKPARTVKFPVFVDSSLKGWASPRSRISRFCQRSCDVLLCRTQANSSRRLSFLFFFFFCYVIPPVLIDSDRGISLFHYKRSWCTSTNSRRHTNKEAVGYDMKKLKIATL